MKHRLWGEYMMLRGKGFRPAGALAYAKAMEEVVYRGFDFDGERWKGEHKGFDVTVAVRYDEYAGCEMDHYGTFTDRWEEGAIENPHAGWHNEYWTSGRFYQRVNRSFHLGYFVPAEKEEDLRRSLIRYVGKARAAEDARRITEEALTRCLEPEVYIVATDVFQAGVKVAEWAVGGVEFGDYPEVEIWMEFLPEAIAEAEANIETIIEHNAA